MAARQLGGGQFRLQDGHIIHGSGHVRDQWDRRCDDGWEGYELRAAWREAEPVDVSIASGSYYCRYHVESKMILVASWYHVHTAVHIDSYRDQEQDEIRRQAGVSR